MSKAEKANETYPFFNRELSWIEFNARVLDEGMQDSNPLLERLKFLSIVSSNFDEFFMVRIASAKRKIRKSRPSNCPSGLSNEELFKRASDRIRDLVDIQYSYFNRIIVSGLRRNGIYLLSPENLEKEQFDYTVNLFKQEIFPIVSPVRIERGRPLPFTGNCRLHVAFLLEDANGKEEEDKLAVLQIPNSMNRIINIPSQGEETVLTLIEEIIRNNADHLFQGYTIKENVCFRVTRDADLSVDEKRDEDFVEAMEEILVNREHSLPVRLEITGESKELKSRLMQYLGIIEDDVYTVNGPLDLKPFMSLLSLEGYNNLKDEIWGSFQKQELPENADLWSVLQERDISFHHPYESFEPIIRMVTEASRDPDVLAIKMTLYRTSGGSPIVKALAKAAENGKQVTVLVEVKARFDEERNIGWAQQLERSGVIVVYGIAGLKVHAKALMVVRREREGIRKYVHLGTGNYNEKTAKMYTDMGIMTSNEEITYETSLFFNAITGYSSIPHLRHLAMAPVGLKKKLIKLIERESSRSTPERPGIIRAKMNSLSDPDIIEALYKASQAGVKISLNIRGICMLIPGIEEISKNITVISIIDRYLEHSRIFYFYNEGNTEIYLSSSDWMPRNLDRRVELLFPVADPKVRKRVENDLMIFFQDNEKAHVLNTDGTYTRKRPGKHEKRLRCQEYFHKQAKRREELMGGMPVQEFSVRRRPPK